MKDRGMVGILHPQDKIEGAEYEERDRRQGEEKEEEEEGEEELAMVVMGVDSGENMKPIQHPAQPPDEDLPAKYPLPDSFLVDDGGDLKESFIENLRKIVESSSSEDEETSIMQSPVQAASRKRHQTSPRLPVFCPSPRGAQYNIFQVFNQCKSFGTDT